MKTRTAVALIFACANGLTACGSETGPCGEDADPSTRPSAPESISETSIGPVTYQGTMFVARNLQDWQAADFTVEDGTLCYGWRESVGGYTLLANGTPLFTAVRPEGDADWRAHVVEGGLVVEDGFLIVNTDTTLGNRVVRLADNEALAVDFVPLDATYANGETFLVPGQSMTYAATVAVYKKADGMWEVGAALYQTSDNLRLSRARVLTDLGASATPTASGEFDAESGSPLVIVESDGTTTTYVFDPNMNKLTELE
jgi:hypothetical protein